MGRPQRACTLEGMGLIPFIGGTEPHTFHGEDCTVEADLRPSDSALGTVEDDSMLAGCLH